MAKSSQILLSSRKVSSYLELKCKDKVRVFSFLMIVKNLKKLSDIKQMAENKLLKRDENYFSKL